METKQAEYSCLDCGSEMNISTPNNLKAIYADWIRVVCSDCGSVGDVSIVRLTEARR